VLVPTGSNRAGRARYSSGNGGKGRESHVEPRIGERTHYSKCSEGETKDCDDDTLPSCLAILLEGAIV
jgi:hypothetical protein